MRLYMMIIYKNLRRKIMQVVEKKAVNKAVVILLFTMVVFLFLSFQNIQAAGAKIGLVNLAQVMSSHPYTQNINQLSVNLQEELKKRQEELNAQGKGLDETELKKLEDKFNKDWEPIKEKILAEIKSYQAARYSDIIEAIKVVGDKGEYDLMLNSEIKVPAGTDILNYPIALYGGEDITQNVIAEIVRKLEEEQQEKNKTK
ncbi:MAG: OmpH family outer membrane protein [Candidatus Atribacteria bacterium]|nr:MAG: OmpH family outer membrane protein [Candidatus Atribacteria bacterium]